MFCAGKERSMRAVALDLAFALEIADAAAEKDDARHRQLRRANFRSLGDFGSLHWFGGIGCNRRFRAEARDQRHGSNSGHAGHGKKSNEQNTTHDGFPPWVIVTSCHQQERKSLPQQGERCKGEVAVAELGEIVQNNRITSLPEGVSLIALFRLSAQPYPAIHVIHHPMKRRQVDRLDDPHVVQRHVQPLLSQ